MLKINSNNCRNRIPLSQLRTFREASTSRISILTKMNKIEKAVPFVTAFVLY